ncbi:MAG TPA: BTAD domain-containing putative transcriptional regulator [Pseudonocardiaceae bacterium]|nr:BTAD domain-containing putative transcriptional regulator [Pseudonocardiaceae bacterium]
MRIERRSGGYQLTVDPASVDLQRFRGLLTEARSAGDDARAVALFDQALRWWCGTPFADLDTSWSASVRAALEAERQAARLDRVDAALRHRDTGDRAGEQGALRGLGLVPYSHGRYGPASDYFEQALAIARQIGHRAGEHEALGSLGTIHLLQCRYGPATDYLQQALTIARRIGDRAGEESNLRALGHVHRVQGARACHGPLPAGLGHRRSDRQPRRRTVCAVRPRLRPHRAG